MIATPSSFAHRLWRSTLLLLLLFGASVLAAPATSAHGEETHEEEPTAQSVEEPVTEPEQDLAVGGRAGESVDTGAADEAAGFLTILKNLHPASVHFAIALFLVAAAAELVQLARPSEKLQAAVDVMCIAGGAGAVLAAIFGWLHTGFWFGGETSMQIHRWLGSGLALVGAILAISVGRGGTNRNIQRVLLVSLAIAVLVQGYLGGELAHGAGHLWKH